VLRVPLRPSRDAQSSETSLTPNTIRNTVWRVAVPVVPNDRRRLRREQTVAEILAVAVQAMATDGVAGMSLSDVARRVGMRPPSLYEYFPSKLAIYDAVFHDGFETLNSVLRAAIPDFENDPIKALRTVHPIFVRWCIENPVQSQLMFWRPVPGFNPSPAAFAPSIEQVGMVRDLLQAAVRMGQLTEGAVTEEGMGLYSFIGSGLITQQLANDPAGGFPDGQYSRLASASLEMWISHYSPADHADRPPTARSTP
jgi:AcrR family transcriptional regulator